MTYEQFIENKKEKHIFSGWDIDVSDLNDNLFPFQKYIVKRAIKAGKFAIFSDCGTGKTIMELAWSHAVMQHEDRPVLILTFLAVVGQFIEEGQKFGIEVNRYIPEMYAMDELPTGIYITNYDQIDNVNPEDYCAIVLDESSIMKNYEGKIKTEIISLFKDTKYKLAATATPSPNDPMEIGNHAEFLDVMGRNEMLSMFFVHDGGQTAKWRLKGHAIDTFYQFVSQWAIMVSNPKDIGFPMQGYELPKLNFIEKQIITPKKDNGLLFNDAAISATDFNKELRITKESRLNEVAKIVNGSKDQFIIWIKQNEEGDYLRKLIPDAIEVKGSDTPEYKEQYLLGFAHNNFRVLITKTKIAQFGLNYQNCHNQVFAALDFSFEGLYQAIRRSYRFGQKEQVNIYLITTDTMSNVIESIREKESKFKIMQDKMAKFVNSHIGESEEINPYDPVENKNYRAYNMDCVKGLRMLPDESIGLSVFSPPFAELYTYSSLTEDMGNSKDYKEFLTQFGFLTKELFRVVKSGRNVCIHCMDLPIQKGKEGVIGLRDFSNMIRESMELAGFIYHSRITIWKDPVVEMQRTKALGLLHKQVKKDSTMSRVGIPDYVLIFRKDGERADPVSNTEISVDLWQKIASPVWMDINQSDTLQGFRQAKDEKDEKHICPLQLPVIERLILLYSNKGDTVMTPFGGIGSEGYQAIKMERNAILFELKPSYFKQLVKNCNNAIEEMFQQSLFKTA